MRTGTVLALFLMMLPITALAQRPSAAERAACQADVDKFCPNVQPGGGRILDCLAQVKDKISPACQAVLTNHGR